jgi:BirA family transcriptional regulator, biotin operon repressor / biotin---[acetyl-CoA-carboxylase] ligase
MTALGIPPVPVPLPRDVAAAVAAAGARLGLFADRIQWFSEVTSTNDIVTTLAEAGNGEGVVVAADAQNAGRGRFGRDWASPHGAGIYASVLLRPPAAALRLVTIAAGVALADGIRAATGLTLQLKWPNDLVADGGPGARKVAGILAEGGVTPEGSPWVVLGFGINVLSAALPREVGLRASSLEQELGRPVDRGLVFAECLAALAGRYRQLQEGAMAPVVADWRVRAAATLGRAVEWNDGARRQGVAEDVDEHGSLIVRSDSGTVRIISGEVRWL